MFGLMSAMCAHRNKPKTVKGVVLLSEVDSADGITEERDQQANLA